MGAMDGRLRHTDRLDGQTTDGLDHGRDGRTTKTDGHKAATYGWPEWTDVRLSVHPDRWTAGKDGPAGRTGVTDGRARQMDGCHGRIGATNGWS